MKKLYRIKKTNVKKLVSYLKLKQRQEKTDIKQKDGIRRNI
jgi:hypothetical protein